MQDPQRKLDILVVDDEPEIRAAVAEILTGSGHTVILAANGLEAIAQVKARPDVGKPFDLVISDFRMPKLDGVGLLKKIKADWPDVPVFIMTAYAPHSEQEILALGADRYLSKPFSSAFLLLSIQEHITKATVPSTKTPPRLKIIHILEDDLIDRTVIKCALAAQPWKDLVSISFFDSGESFLAHLRSSDAPDLALLDIKLPGISGIDVLEAVRIDGKIATATKFVMLSGSKLSSDLARSSELKCDAYHTKPHSPEELKHLMRAIQQSWLPDI